MDRYEQDLGGNLQRLHARVHSGQYWPKPVLRAYIRKPMEANGLLAFPRSKTRSSRARWRRC
jgi:retron-type reverse transcriptase